MAISMPLVSGGELAAHLRDEELLVCDCRFAGDADASREQYESGHIPGAIHVYWLDDLSAADTTVTTFLPRPRGSRRLRSVASGITHERTVVAYSRWRQPVRVAAVACSDALRPRAASRLLDGGIEKWQAERRPLERGS